MEIGNPRSTARFFGHPIHPMLVPFPIAFFTGAFLADLVHRLAPDPFWTEAAFWLLVGALVGAVMAAITGLVDFVGDRRIRSLGDARQHMVGNIVIVLIEAINLVLRARDADRAVAAGLYLSAAAALLLGFTGWKGGELVFHHRVGLSDERG